MTGTIIANWWEVAARPEVSRSLPGAICARTRHAFQTAQIRKTGYICFGFKGYSVLYQTTPVLKQYLCSIDFRDRWGWESDPFHTDAV